MTPLALGGIATVDVPVSLLPVAGAVDAFALAANREDSESLVSVDGWARRFPLGWSPRLVRFPNVISASHARAGCIPFAI